LRTAIVGFPGETDEHFEHLVQFVRHEFDHVGVFTFHREETPAQTAESSAPRHHGRDDGRLMAVQQPISLNKNQAEVGKVVDVLIEQENPETGELMVALLGFAGGGWFSLRPR